MKQESFSGKLRALTATKGKEEKKSKIEFSTCAQGKYFIGNKPENLVAH
jgi:hypothetical protein